MKLDKQPVIMLCYRCKRQGHMTKDCFSTRDADGNVINDSRDETDSEYVESEYDSDSDYLGSDSDEN